MLRLLALVLSTSLVSAADPAVIPALQRIDFTEPGASTSITLDIVADPGVSILTTATDCACLHVTTSLPAQVGANGRLPLTVTVSGLRTGVKTILISTSAGIARAQVQVAGPGGGSGRHGLETALAEAAAKGLSVIGIVHNLRGQTKNCGCSTGSLGGAAILAAVPGLTKQLAPGLPTRWVLTGDADGTTAGLGAALAAKGWTANDPSTVVTDSPLAALGTPGVSLVISTGSDRTQNSRILRPALDRGMAIDLVMLDARGMPVGTAVIPVDQTLGEVAGFTDAFPPPRTWTVVDRPSPSTACAGCHPAAFQAWAKSRHAHALESLPTADRHDACLACHVLPLKGTQVAAGVNCQSCHLGSDKHIAGAGMVKTTGTVDCRSCHDAQHHPAFQREKAWKVIEHGR